MPEPTLTTVLEGITQVHGQLVQLCDEHAETRKDLAQLRHDFAQFRQTVLTAITQLQKDVAQLQRDVAQLQRETTRLRTEFGDALERIQDSIRQLRDDAQATYARLERVEKTTAEQINGLIQEISVIHRQIRSLQEEVRILRGDK